MTLASVNLRVHTEDNYRKQEGLLYIQESRAKHHNTQVLFKSAKLHRNVVLCCINYYLVNNVPAYYTRVGLDDL